MATNTNIAQEVEMDQILVTPVDPTIISMHLEYDLYDIQSVKTTQAMILATPAVQTESADFTNTFYVQKTSDDALLQTAVSAGVFKLTKTVQSEDSEESEELLYVTLKRAELPAE